MLNTAEILLSDATAALSDAPVTMSVPSSVNESAAIEWTELLALRNGFSAMGGALLVLPTKATGRVPAVGEFNRPRGWKRYYALEPFFAFALDGMGWPIGIREDGLARLNPELGTFEPLGASIAGFAQRLHKGTVDIGQTVVQRWAHSFGPLTPDTRLMPRRPIAVGGTRAVSNLRTWPTNAAAQTYGVLAHQLQAADEDDGFSLAWPPGRP